MFHGESIDLIPLDDGFVELRFDRKGDAINKLDHRTIRELATATKTLANLPDLRGVLVTSAKDAFIVGADINEFDTLFQLPAEDIAADIARSNLVFNAFEDLPVPSVAAVNGFALGGGLEMALVCTYRVLSSTAQIGVPEVKLGLFPGFGGTVRLPRIANAGVAIDWISSGKPAKAEAALAAGVADAVTAPDALRAAALEMLHQAAAGTRDWRAATARKQAPLPQPAAELDALFTAAKAKVAAGSAKHQPAALAAVELMAAAAGLDRSGALPQESAGFGRIARTQAAGALVQTFHNEHALKKLARAHSKQARPVKLGAVLGAGIMGGGIAYTSALRGTPVRMKDIAEKSLELGMAEAGKHLAKQVKNGRLSQEKADAVLASITPQLDYAGFDQADIVIEAVVENIKVKHAVLGELESLVRDDAVIASNTSSLRIDDIAVPLKRPENFVGMHFFNPVPVMALVEVIQGSKTSDVAVSTAVGYAVAMGKTPIVVKDCPGFLVNRLLTAYIRAFIQVIAEGGDFVKIDQAMEAFGWPMGPAYLEDVIGLDTGSHVNDIVSAGYPDRMPALANDPLRLMVSQQRLGQKNGIGFYRYEADPAGKPRRSVAEDSHALLAALQPNGTRDFAADEIVERLMQAMVVEAACALEEGVVASPAELDMAMLLGLGFPAYAGGPLKYADYLGLAEIIRRGEKYAHLGRQYQATERMRRMAASGERYYPA